MTRDEMAVQNFMKGYNCTQAVVLAFSDLLPVEPDTLLKISSSFGGGMGRLREVCGAVSGMFIVAGALYGYGTPETGAVKAAHYAAIQELAHRFEEKTGSIVCRELLGLSVKHDPPTPAPRTPDFFKKRPCANMIRTAAAILDEYITAHPVTESPCPAQSGSEKGRNVPENSGKSN